MPRLFWRIFFCFWITITLFAGFMGGFSDHLARQLRLDPDFQNQDRDITQASRHLAEKFSGLDRSGIVNLLRQLGPRQRNMIFVVDKNSKEVLGRDRELRHILPLIKKSGLPVIKSKDLAGNELRIIVASRAHKHLLVSGTRRGTVARIVAAAILSALVSYFLARSLTSPLTRLRQTTRQIASGDLGARTDSGLVSRRDEIGQLASDLDHMATKLQQLDQGRTRLLTDVSHELRSPLARLQVALELAREKRSGDITAELDRIGLESNRLNDLIDQVLNLLRETTASLPMQKSRQDLNAVIHTVADQANYEPFANNQKGVVFTDSDPLYCEIDTELVMRALDNVLRNALRYTDPDKGVEVSSHKNGQNVQITIRDFGPGVPTDHLNKLFDAFYRVSDARDRDSGGHGLGLAIAAASVMRHDGEITASNHPHGGLLITIYLPV